MQREIKHSTFFPHPIEVVWDHLTKPELLSQWLMENDIQPIVGHNFQFRAKPVLEIDFDGMVYCEILEVAPLKKLSYSWKCNPTNGKFKIDTVVVWTLVPKKNGTELNLHQTGFKKNEYDGFYSAMKNGWPVRTEIFLKTLNSLAK
jgi:uncharacterized protein YndB with AHSA1/START domain